ncbi:MAG: glucosaminidase domain-containing protein [Bacteroidetes bacterium]|nr:glucosaminidase domain-containing protein [Bacteroidota bacterium]
MKKTLLILTLLISSLAASAQNTSTSYIEKFKDDAVRIMHESGIPASIVLAVAMHESGCGNSLLAKEFNNQFGVKGLDKHVLIVHNREKLTSYKKYGSIMDSFEDFSRIISNRRQLSYLQNLTHYDYVGWAKGIQKSGYAASRKWSRDVLGLITKYHLNLFDENPADQPQVVASVK